MLLILYKIQMTRKLFDEWNTIKKIVNEKDEVVEFKEKDIFWTNIGENIGFEQNGKGKEFSRPVLVVKKLNKRLFFGVPLSTTLRKGTYFYNFQFLKAHKNSALLVQAKVFDIKRVDTKLGMINSDDFKKLKVQLKELLDL